MALNTDMPNLFVVGAEKCGTTSLHHYLSLHPEVSMSTRKETGYFARSTDDLRLARVRDRDEYLAMFEPGVPVRGESCTAYSSFPELGGVPARIAAETIDPKFIYLVRDPIERIKSALRGWISYGQLGAGVESLVIQDLPRSFMLSRSKYMTQIRQYLEHFPRGSILVFDSDRLRRERMTVLSEIFGFLQVDFDFEHSGFLEERNTGASKNVPPALWERLRSMPFADGIVRVTPDRLRLKVRTVRSRLSASVGRPIPEVVLTEGLEEKLRSQLETEVADLREFTGFDFPAWSL